MTGEFYTPGEYRPRRKLTDRGKAAALAYVRRYGVHLAAMAASAGIGASAMRNAARDDLAFSDAIQEANATFVTECLKAAKARAVDGFLGANGERKYSDRLLLALLQAADRERFGNRVEVDQKTRVTVDLPDTRKWPREAKIKLEEAFALAETAGAPDPAAGPAPVEAEFQVHETAQPDPEDYDDGDRSAE